MDQHRKTPAAVIITMDLDDHEACAATERAPSYFDEGASLDSFDVLVDEHITSRPSRSSRLP